MEEPGLNPARLMTSGLSVIPQPLIAIYISAVCLYLSRLIQTRVLPPSGNNSPVYLAVILLRVLTTSEASVARLDENLGKIWSSFPSIATGAVHNSLFTAFCSDLTDFGWNSLFFLHMRVLEQSPRSRQFLLIAVISASVRTRRSQFAAMLASACKHSPENRMPAFFFCLH